VNHAGAIDHRVLTVEFDLPVEKATTGIAVLVGQDIAKSANVAILVLRCAMLVTEGIVMTASIGTVTVELTVLVDVEAVKSRCQTEVIVANLDWLSLNLAVVDIVDVVLLTLVVRSGNALC